MQTGIDIDALHGFIDESNDSLQGIEADFVALEREPSNVDIINKIFRPVHSLKGNSGFFGLININKFSHRLENLLDATRNGEIIITTDIIDVLLTGVDYLKQMLDRALEDPEDTTLRSDEKEFLERVEQHRPQQATGTIQSVIDFEATLNEALDIGYNINENQLITSLLDQIEKSNKEIRKAIATHKSSPLQSAYSPDKRYHFKNNDYTALIKPLGEVQNRLAEKKTTSGDLLKNFSSTLDQLAELFNDNVQLSKCIDELYSMRNFLDDELMSTTNEFTEPTSKLINSIISAFEAKGGEDDSENRRLGEILIEQNLATEDQISEALKKQKKIGELLVEEGAINSQDLQKALDIQKKRMLKSHMKSDKPAEITKTIRIDQHRLDNFANKVGELYINIDSIGYLKKQLEQQKVDHSLISRFDSAIVALGDRVDQLQDSIMSIRRIPVKTLFQRFPRVVRQLSASLGKDINFQILGDETVIDKDLLEKIENPLVHILRNSVDHGIEVPEERTEKEKPATGSLELIATSDENNVYLTIKDDGQGIDPQKMKQIAIKKGLMSADDLEQLSDKELINLIFRPGFSSAEKISDVSGRGVGMDVVLSGLKECNGSINVDSEVSKGTTITFTIPLTKTLVTKDAMIVKCGEQDYVIFSEDVTTVMETNNELIPIMAEGNCISYDNTILKVIDVNDFFYPQQQKGSRNGKDKVAAVCKEHRIALLVDSVLSHQKVVVKDFVRGSKKFNDVEGICGYTIMGNEDVVLILDPNEIAEYSEAI